MTERLERIAREAEELARSRFRELEETAEHNTARILQAFRSHRVSEAMFAGSTGYGYDDLGRDTLDQIWAEVFGTEAALVRLGFVNGPMPSPRDLCPFAQRRCPALCNGDAV